MATPTNTYTAHTAIGIREDLSDVIYDISPMDTPFLSNIARDSASQNKVEWLTDALATAAENRVIEGDDATTDASADAKRFNNYCQISDKVPRVTGTLRTVNTAGRADEMSYQIAKRGRELKRDMEVTLCGTQVATAGSLVSARASAGLAGWLFTNQVQTAQTQTTPAVTAGHPSVAPTAGTAVAFTSEHLLSCIAQCWTQGGDPKMILMDAANKRIASGFTGIATQYRDNPQVGPAVLIGAADVFVSDFGTHSLIASRFVPSDIVYALDLEYWSVAYLRPIQQHELAKTGDSDRVQILAEYTLCAKNPDASGKIYSTT
jgi:hypothetical protein